MIKKIRMQKVASFEAATSLETDKRVNLIYGLNGTGKSTISDFLYNPDDSRFANCEILPKMPGKVFVYNQSFVRDYFFEKDGLRGVFTLSSENRAAEEEIDKAKAAIKEVKSNVDMTQEKRSQVLADWERQEQQALDEVWRIKRDHAGASRALDYCLDRLKGDRERLFSHLISISQPETEPERGVSDIRRDAEALQGEEVALEAELPELTFGAHDVEEATIFGRAIIGSEESEAATLIQSLGNADWVREGLRYVSDQVDDYAGQCPFCQEKTITKALVARLDAHFDDAYQNDITILESLRERYERAFESIRALETYTGHSLIGESAAAIVEKYGKFLDVVKLNMDGISKKLKHPSTIQRLEDSRHLVAGFNAELETINSAVRAHNEKLQDREKALEALKREFWELMRWKYQATIGRYERDRAVKESKLASVETEVRALNRALEEERGRIAKAQKQTVNTREAVDSINAGLAELGIEDFRIEQHSERLYRVVRSDQFGDVFSTLSEGEKMIISFLYFCELCRGRASPGEADVERIAVVDDPISSLSHVFIFNVGQLIKQRFFREARFSQVFVLTHSLYFFYELAERKKERRREKQGLFRLSKPASGSKLAEMKYDEVRNDYEAFWSVVNDPDAQPALIANCMRNIVEYFFGFVRGQTVNNAFQSPELAEPRFQAFNRFVNRESHSDAQNIMDLKEFDYATFIEGLRLVFDKAGYQEHFEEMCRV